MPENTPEERRKRKNLALLAVLVGLIVIFYSLTILKLTR